VNLKTGRQRDLVIVGAGHAGVNLASYLAKSGFDGSIALIGDEPELPYKRPPLSKGFLLGTESAEQLLLRSAQYWESSQIELMRGVKVDRIVPDSRKVCAGGSELRYERLVWAAGGRARSLDVRGSALDGVHHVRTLRDVMRLKEHVKAARTAVIVGGGYIGLEVAASLRSHAVQVTVIESADRLLARVTSSAVSEFFQSLHRNAGVDVLLGSQVKKFCGQDGRLRSVVLTDGRELDSDLVVVGVGLVPNDDVLRESGAECGDGILVDDLCRTSLPGVFAIGDCASQSSPILDHGRVRIESLQNANEQAKVVASQLLDAPLPSRGAPWFWSEQYDTKLKTVGLIAGHDQAVVRGDPASGMFSVAYLAGGRLVALDTVNNAADFAQGRSMIERTRNPTVDVSALGDPDCPLRRCVMAS
jgi:3-phenylpropionate/trans-cinnamate dioxygenase ferredoxin reductase subunit